MSRPKAGFILLAAWCGLVGVMAMGVGTLGLFHGQGSQSIPFLIIGSLGLGLAYLFGRPS